MTSNEIISKLESLASEKYKANVIKMGIPEENSIGVSTGDVRALAKSIPKSNELAFELWNTGYHEAKLLAVLVFDKKTLDIEKIPDLMNQVFSWDLCDHICKNLIIKLKGYQEFIFDWCNSGKTYRKRAAFTLIASSAMHENTLTDEEINNYLALIREHSSDEREHVKKSISWALREIGKKDFNCQEKAVLLAHELIDSGNKAQVWIGRDALKELENLVQVKGRGRLISADSKMGKEQADSQCIGL